MAKIIVVWLCIMFSSILNADAQTSNGLSLANVPGRISNAQGNDTAGVLKLIGGFQVALFRGDARAFADLFAEDADFINVIDKSIHGREDIYRLHISVFKGRPATRKNNVLSYTVRFFET
jgi:hypothetical protein